MKRRPLARQGEEEERRLAQTWATLDGSAGDVETLFLKLLRELLPGDRVDQQALVLGGGSGTASIGFLKAWPGAHCDLVDPVSARLEIIATALKALPGVARRCRLLPGDLASTALPPCAYDLVLSSGLLHRLTDPLDLWRILQRVAKIGAPILVMDLMRPPSPGWAESLVATYAADAPASLQQDYRAALFAAFEPAEVEAQLDAAGISHLEVVVVSDRHLAIRHIPL